MGFTTWAIQRLEEVPLSRKSKIRKYVFSWIFIFCNSVFFPTFSKRLGRITNWSNLNEKLIWKSCGVHTWVDCCVKFRLFLKLNFFSKIRIYSKILGLEKSTGHILTFWIPKFKQRTTSVISLHLYIYSHQEDDTLFKLSL